MLFSLHGGLKLLAPLGGFVLVAAAIVVLLGPWWLRIARDLLFERQARARAEERADMAARVHDSVLQTLALIQRSADDPQTVVQLARAQERELRSWLFEGRAPGDTEVTSFAEGIRRSSGTWRPGTAFLSRWSRSATARSTMHLSALLAAAREATVNAAKWSGASVISLFAEVEPDKVEVAVRDRGSGFDLYSVPGGSQGRRGVHPRPDAQARRQGGRAVDAGRGDEGDADDGAGPRSGRAAAADGRRR